MKQLLAILLVTFTIDFSVAQITLPTDISGLSLWFTGDSVELTGDTVSTWYDLSGNNNHATQSSVNAKPVFVDSIPVINYKPVVRFDGFDDFLQFNEISNIKFAFFVVKHSTGFQIFPPLLGHPSLYNWHGGNDSMLFTTSVTPELVNGSGFVNGNLTPVATITKPVQYAILSFIPSDSVSAEYITNDRNIAGRVWAGDYAEIILYDSVLSDTERITIEQYLRNKYAPLVYLVADTSVDYGFCPVQISAGQRFTSYLWSPNGETTDTISITESGTYSVTVTDIFGFTSVDSINVTFPNVNLNLSNTTICAGDSVLLKPQLFSYINYTFLWSSGNTTPEIYAKTQDNYWIQTTDTSCGSKTSNTIVVSVDSLAYQVSLGNDTSICSGNAISIISPSTYPFPLFFEWQDGTTDSLFTVNINGTYFITVTNPIGCFATDSITVTIIGTAPQTDFSFDTVCLGDSTHFVNLTSGIVDSLFWDFGDAGSSNDTNPIHIYNSVGTYPVILFALQGPCSKTTQKNVIIKSIPTANFTTQETCISLPYQFIDNSTSNLPDVIISWNWSFGDAGSSNDTNPIHTYSVSDNYNVLLSVTSSNGCSDTVSKIINIVASAPFPTIAELLTPQDNSILGEGNIIFSWNNSNNANKYQLIVSTYQDFTDTILDSVSVNTSIIINSSIFYSNNLYWKVLSYNLCDNYISSSLFTLSLFNQSTISGLSLWFTGDSVELTGDTVNTWFDLSGNNNHATQSSVNAKPVFVDSIPVINYKPVVRFDGFNDFLQFNEISNINSGFFIVKHSTGFQSFPPLLGHPSLNNWHGGNDSMLFTTSVTPELVNGSGFVNGNLTPVATITKPVQYVILSFIPSDSVSAEYITNDRNLAGRVWAGDYAEIILYDTVLSDSERITIEQYLRNKYAPLVYLGPDITVDYGFCPVPISAGQRFTSYLWSPNGETTDTITITESGTYSVTVTDIFGFTSSDNIKVIFPFKKPFNDTTICAGDTLQWNSSLDKTGYSFLWQDSLSTDSFYNITGEGQYYVKIIDNFFCPFNSDTVLISVDSFAFKATLGPDTTICSGNYIEIVNADTTQIISYLWSTGQSTPTFTIDTSGNYGVIAENFRGCLLEDSINITIDGAAPVTGFYNDIVCTYSNVQFIDTSTTIDGSTIIDWFWNFGDGDTSPSDTATHIFTYIDNFNVTLTILTDSGCYGKITKTITAHPSPLADFMPVTGCEDDTLNFSDLSTILNDTIFFWNWKFDSDSYSVQNPWYLFTDTGAHNISLLVKTNFGCKDTVSKIVYIKPSPVADFAVTSPLCGLSPAGFTDNSVISFPWSIISRKWTFGDNSTSTLPAPVHSYSSSGTYDVKLYVVALNGCSSTINKPVTLYNDPSANFTFLPACSGTPALFTDSSVNTPVNNDFINNWVWKINGENISGSSNISYTFLNPGSQIVKLSVYTTAGCMDSVSKSITINPSPQSLFSITPAASVPGQIVQLDNSTTGALSFMWNFGDGDVSTLQNPFHIYADTGSYSVLLVSESDAGCLDSAVKTISVIRSYHDVAVSTVETTVKSKFLKVTANLQNLGTTTIDSVEMYLKIDGMRELQEILHHTFLPGAIYLFTFSTAVQLNTQEPEFVCVSAQNPNGKSDEVPENNEYCLAYNGKLSVYTITSPVSNTITLEIILPKQDDITITFIDLKGSVLSEQTHIGLKKGLNVISYRVNFLAIGFYLIKISSGDVTIIEKLLKY